MLTGYYKKQKKRFKKRLMKGINLSEEKHKKHQYAQEQYRNLSEEKTKSINKVVNYIQIFKG